MFTKSLSLSLSHSELKTSVLRNPQDRRIIVSPRFQK